MPSRALLDARFAQFHHPRLPEDFLFQTDLAASQHLSDVAGEQISDTVFNHGDQAGIR